MQLVSCGRTLPWKDQVDHLIQRPWADQVICYVTNESSTDLQSKDAELLHAFYINSQHCDSCHCSDTELLKAQDIWYIQQSNTSVEKQKSSTNTSCAQVSNIITTATAAGVINNNGLLRLCRAPWKTIMETRTVLMGKIREAINFKNTEFLLCSF